MISNKNDEEKHLLDCHRLLSRFLIKSHEWMPPRYEIIKWLAVYVEVVTVFVCTETYVEAYTQNAHTSMSSDS